MTHEIERWDAEEWLQKNKDIWNHPMVTDRTDSNAYEVADLMAEFANYILSKQKQKTKDMKQTAVDFSYDEIWACFSSKLSWTECERLNNIKKQAKEMEKLTMINALIEFSKAHFDIHTEEAILNITRRAEKYYNKTYGGNK